MGTPGRFRYIRCYPVYYRTSNVLAVWEVDGLCLNLLQVQGLLLVTLVNEMWSNTVSNLYIVTVYVITWLFVALAELDRATKPYTPKGTIVFNLHQVVMNYCLVTVTPLAESHTKVQCIYNTCRYELYVLLMIMYRSWWPIHIWMTPLKMVTFQCHLHVGRLNYLEHTESV